MATPKAKVGVSLSDGVYAVIVERYTREYGVIRETVADLKRSHGYTRNLAESYAFGVVKGLRVAGKAVEGGVYEW